jgi:hypothetical protein
MRGSGVSVLSCASAFSEMVIQSGTYQAEIVATEIRIERAAAGYLCDRRHVIQAYIEIFALQ